MGHKWHTGLYPNGCLDDAYAYFFFNAAAVFLTLILVIYYRVSTNTEY